MKPNEIADGKYNHIDVIGYLQGKPKSSIKKYLDKMVGEACLLSVGMVGSSQDHYKAQRLFDIVELVSEALLPDYPSRQGGGYQNSQVSGSANQPMDFPQEKTPRERLPQELSTEKAMQYWRKSVEVGFVDKDFNLLKTITKEGKIIQITDFIIANFCFTFSTKLGLKYKYSYFKKLWGKKYLPQAKQRADELGYYVGDEIINDIFNN